MFDFDYNKALFRKDNNGNPCVWYAEPVGKSWIKVCHGIVGKHITETIITSSRIAQDEVESKINEKRKQGYKYINELKDNVSLPVEEALIDYLNTYLDNYRTSSDGSLLPMLAKTFDNTNNKVFKKVSQYYGQWKINGLRCFARFYVENTGLFPEIRIDFQSREGVHWKSLRNLEEYMLNTIPKGLQAYMIDNNYILDGEVYLPGYSVNDINHFVKDPNSFGNKALQYWCYDIAVEDCVQKERFEILDKFDKFLFKECNSKTIHLNNKERFVLLPLVSVSNEEDARIFRDAFIDLGFEGLIMRNPSAEYQYGSRKANIMIKYKRSTDGKFQIIEINPEGAKRPDIPLFVCRNDINDALFECHVGGSEEYQKSILKNKADYIGKYMYVEYGERSGVYQLPFHIKETRIINE